LRATRWRGVRGWCPGPSDARAHVARWAVARARRWLCTGLNDAMIDARTVVRAVVRRDPSEALELGEHASASSDQRRCS
jgi:hypothetical protein